MTPEVIISIVTLLVTCPPSVLLLWNWVKRWMMTTADDHRIFIPSRVRGQRALSLGSAGNYPRPVRALTRRTTHHSFNEGDVELGLGCMVIMVREYGTH